MEHYIFTNFGVGIKDFSWLSYRFELFSNVCANSLRNQTILQFKWVVFVDVDLPYIIRNKVEEIALASPFEMTIVQVSDYSTIQNEIQHLLKSNAVGDYLLTSRIDDDDALAKDAVEQIHARAKAAIDNKVNNMVISLQNGFEWLPGDDLYRLVQHDTLALGLSLLSKKDSFGYNVNQFAHHIIVDTIRKLDSEVVFEKIYTETAGYLYTKHSLSDSYFTGSRARIVRDKNTEACNAEVISEIFGINKEKSQVLKTYFSESPMGMPYKYLALSAEIKKNILSEDSTDESEFNKDLNKFKLKWMQTHATKKHFKKDRKIRLAIIGSCVSRDIFTHSSNFGEQFELVAYVARQNLASYVAMPNTDSKLLSRISGVGFEDKRALWDLNKKHWQILEAAQPDVIILDFIDERIGAIFHEGSIHTASGPIIKAFERSSDSFIIERPWGVKLKSIRSWAAREFMNRVFSICDNIIVHKASWALEYFDSDGETQPFSTTEFSKLVELNNKVLDDVFSGLSSSGIPFEMVGGGALMKSGGGHLWSFCPYHYCQSYYNNLAKEIRWRV